MVRVKSLTLVQAYEQKATFRIWENDREIEVYQLPNGTWLCSVCRQGEIPNPPCQHIRRAMVMSVNPRALI
jgi:hypothetical protein